MTEEPVLLVDLVVTSALVLPDGEPLVTVEAVGPDGTLLSGQVTADGAREMATAWLVAAEAAESDATLLQFMRQTLEDDGGNLEEQALAAVALLRDLRHQRKEATTDTHNT